MIYTTPDRPHPEGGFLRAHFGLHFIGDQAPYCTLTGTHVSKVNAVRDRDVIACGQLHPDLLEVFPELGPFANWHLASGGIPMHYIANAKYWHDLHTGVSEWEPPQGLDVADTFVRHATPLDAADRAMLIGLLDETWAHAQPVLEARRERLQERYRAEIVDALPALAQQLHADEGAR
jgi:hypothetical protein